MTQIKSEKAKNYLLSLAPEIQGDESIEIIIAKKVIVLAETEAEERHAKELQEFKDKAVEAAKYACPVYDDGREMCWVKNGESNQKCDGKCLFIKDFTAKLNEK